jgi:hypothetical protein
MSRTSGLRPGSAASQAIVETVPAPARRADLAEILVEQALNLLRGCSGPRIEQAKLERDHLIEEALVIHHGHSVRAERCGSFIATR